jgi:hypothetical protein
MKRGMAVIAIIGILVVVALFVYAYPSSNMNSSSSTFSNGPQEDVSLTGSISSSVSTSNANQGSGPNFILDSGLKFSFVINPTMLPSNHNLSLSVELLNVQGTSNNFTTGSNWPMNGLVSNSPCNGWFFPMKFGIARGHYTSANLSSLTLLSLFDPTAVYACPAEFLISHYLFQPSSDLATTNVNSNPVIMNESMKIGGYWTGSPMSPGSGVFHYFEPGSYTAVSGDEWGDMILLYFSVG